jgi:uncharacterized protein YraI
VSKLWIVFCMIILVGCSVNSAQSIPTPSQNQPEHPLLIDTIVPTQTIATETAAPTLASTDTINKIYATPKLDAGDINIRSGPMISSSTVGTLKMGEKAPVLGTDPNDQWVFIEFPQSSQGKGWVFIGLVNITGGTPPIIDPVTDDVISPTSTAVGSQTGNPQAMSAIKQYLQQDNIDIAYLGPFDNLNFPGQKAGRYHAGTTDFLVELQTNHIVEIDIGSGTGLTGTSRQYKPQELESMAKGLIASLAPHVNLASLTFQLESKGNAKSIIYFFHWEDTHIGSIAHPFIYVAYNLEGKMVGFINALGVE